MKYLAAIDKFKMSDYLSKDHVNSGEVIHSFCHEHDLSFYYTYDRLRHNWKDLVYGSYNFEIGTVMGTFPPRFIDIPDTFRGPERPR